MSLPVTYFVNNEHKYFLLNLIIQVLIELMSLSLPQMRPSSNTEDLVKSLALP